LAPAGKLSLRCCPIVVDGASSDRRAQLKED
jgi:hypothetical protein